MLSPCLQCPLRTAGGSWKGDGPPRICPPGRPCPIDHQVKPPGTYVAPPVATKPAGGPGTELRKMFADLGLSEVPNCQCKVHAAEMDVRGPDWCEANIETIVGWLREEAERQGMGGVFVAWTARKVIKRAITQSRNP